jgi:D-alanine-D-alanine ligase
MRAVDPARYDVHPVAILRDGTWVHAEAAARALASGPSHIPEALEAAGPPVAPSTVLESPNGDTTVVVFPLLHGPLGEDGTVQGLIELLGLPYVGSGVLASAIGMDKSIAKRLLEHAGVAVARACTLQEHRRTPKVAAEALRALGTPVFVKPANMGSSIGVSRVTTVAELDAALDLAFSYDETVLIEEAIAGREIEVAVLGNLSPRASLPGEIVPSHDFYDYSDKYEGDGAALLVPAPLDEHEVATVQALAITVFETLRCSGMARVDFFYDAAGRGFVCNEVNTIPGFTPISMYPKLWAASGVDYTTLIDELVRLAIERHARRRRRTDR